MTNAPRALAALHQEHRITRPGWRNKFGLAAESFPGLSETGEPGPLVIVRVNADGSRWPWTPTEDDLFATDWQTITTVPDGADAIFGSGAPSDDGDSFAWALSEIIAGREVLIGSGPLRLALGTTHGGPCIDIILPNGLRRLWRPQHQDLWGVYSAA
jgi:hypothetical protein